MKIKYDYLVYIGQFQPFDGVHHAILTQAFECADTVIVIIGCGIPRTPSRPFDVAEQKYMIAKAAAYPHRLLCLAVTDTLYDDGKWRVAVEQAVYQAVGTHTANVGILGYHGNSHFAYLSLFEHWSKVNIVHPPSAVSGKSVLQAYFLESVIADTLPTTTIEFLQQFLLTSYYDRMQVEYRHIHQYQLSWQSAPYIPVFVTADALVVQDGHILLIERGGEYGQGLWALPGGFLDAHETLLDCAIREVKEEAGLKLDISTLQAHQTFDAPNRSARGRTLTTVFYFMLPSGKKLPQVAAGDDAKRAFWMPIERLESTQFFEDHYAIIQNMLNLP